ncbi:MAG: ABC transporter permease [Prevotellaceae bacterium]|jgi:ABC-type lipoprotein release transport system permease subunit|nr:ABC transporter permease [Prevotellaceae bacterium]
MIKLSWRNIWRNRRRSLITMASVLFAVFFCSTMNSYMKGMWGRMIDNTLRTQNGHIEIHGAGWWDDKIIDNFLTMDSATIEKLRGLENIDNVSPRIETFALASLGNVSKGIALVAVSPAQENVKSKLANRVMQGYYLTEHDNGILIGEGLAKYLKAAVGDTLAFIGQGHFGASAAGLFPIRGILHLAIPEMDNNLVYTSLPAAQTFIDMPAGYSGILITLKKDKFLDEGVENVQKLITNNYTLHSNNYEVMSWHFTMKKLLETAASDQAFGKIILFILYLIVGFGILGTVIMLTTERTREFRTMISLGMSRRRLQGVVALELLFMTFIGLVAGIAVSLPVACYFHANPIKITGELATSFLDMGMEPIIPFSIEPQIFISQVIIVLFISIIAVIYPLQKIKKLKLYN